MYSIYVGNQLIYSPPVVNDGYIAYDATVTRELNKVDTASFKIPTSGFGYNRINKLKSVITIKDDNEVIFRGRCMNVTKDFQNIRNFYCEGALGYLNDSVLRPYSFSTDTPGNIFRYFIQQHNARVDSFKQFQLYLADTMQDDQLVRASDQYPTTLNELQEKLIEGYGGYVVIEYGETTNRIDYRKTSGGNNGQVIQFGQNLLDMSEYVDASAVKTILVPLGEIVEGTEQRLTIKSVNNNKDYIESASGIALFGRVEGMETWDDITIASNLLSAGQKRLAQLIAEATTLTLKAVDLSLINVDVDRIRLGEYNRVVSVPHDVDDYFQCTRIVLNLSNPTQNEYTFGNPRPTLTGNLNRFRLK